jgi:hypothetical protein
MHTLNKDYGSSQSSLIRISPQCKNPTTVPGLNTIQKSWLQLVIICYESIRLTGIFA